MRREGVERWHRCTRCGAVLTVLDAPLDKVRCASPSDAQRADPRRWVKETCGGTFEPLSVELAAVWEAAWILGGTEAVRALGRAPT